ncbi:proliferation-associated protein 2G4-like [Artemia franciscana]|uniref:Peptidase M24 domain-containing protein n=1 Tax=Artemia franciscana TaxID=6661 RepID=A0AA88LCE6_ARTSF|nr:hypothetical protein QYM36_003371 [Artemia franciscana]
MSVSGDEEQIEKTIAEDIVVTKYKMAADIVNRVCKKIIERCVAGASVRELCKTADNEVLEETSKVFKKEKDLKKGIAFPTCISVNNCICHFSPLNTDPDYILQDDDLVKVDFGAHVDGFIAVVAHSLVVGASKEKPSTGKKADAILAAHYALEAALRLLKKDNENSEITSAVQKVAESYKCKPIEGMLSHQLKQFKIDGEKTIIQNPNEGQRKEHDKHKFETYEVYAIDVLISTGEGQGREMESRTSIFKKTDETYLLKLKASRQFYSDVNAKCGLMPFNLRIFDSEARARMGVVECVNHKLLDPFQVLYERPNEVVAQFKATVLLMPNGPLRITGGYPVDGDIYQSEHKIEDEEITKLLSTSAKPKKSTKKNKAGKPGEAPAENGEAAVSSA